jgi:sporulation protein YlmC with PRC-barrel domain
MEPRGEPSQGVEAVERAWPTLVVRSRQAEALMSSVTAEDARSLIAAARVQGTAVYNLEGERLGHVEDVMLHRLSGRVAYAVMSFGGFLGLKEKYHPLPWTILKYDTGRSGYVVPLSRLQLEGAPSLSRADIGENDGGWGEKVHTYYQVMPSWM